MVGQLSLSTALAPDDSPPPWKRSTLTAGSFARARVVLSFGKSFPSWLIKTPALKNGIAQGLGIPRTC
jgi:hypothetical protein